MSRLNEITTEKGVHDDLYIDVPREVASGSRNLSMFRLLEDMALVVDPDEHGRRAETLGREFPGVAGVVIFLYVADPEPLT